MRIIIPHLKYPRIANLRGEIVLFFIFSIIVFVLFFGKYRNHKTSFKGNLVQPCPRKIKILPPIINTLIYNALQRIHFIIHVFIIYILLDKVRQNKCTAYVFLHYFSVQVNYRPGYYEVFYTLFAVFIAVFCFVQQTGE